MKRKMHQDNRSKKQKKSKKEDHLNQKKKTQRQESMKVKRRQRKMHVEKTEISIDDVRELDKLYLNGPVSFGSAKRLQKLSKLSMKKLKCIWKRNHLLTNTVHVASGSQVLKLLLTT